MPGCNIVVQVFRNRSKRRVEVLTSPSYSGFLRCRDCLAADLPRSRYRGELMGMGREGFCDPESVRLNSFCHTFFA